MAKSIIINKDYETFVRQLSGTADRKDNAAFDNEQTRIFSNRYNLVRFAAALGYRQKVKEPLPKETIEIVDNRIVEGQKLLKEDINIIAVADFGNESVFDCDEDNEKDNLDKRYEIYLEYLNGGLGLMYKWYNKEINGHHGIINNLLKNDIIKKEEKRLKVEKGKSKKGKRLNIQR